MTLAEQGAVEGDAQPTEAPRVLVVDDDPLMRALAADVLRDGGHSVAEAADAAAARTILSRERVDLVVLDVLMPTTSGLELCAWLRAWPPTEHVPVLVLTGLEHAEVVARAFDAGATDFLRKPFEPAILLHRVQFSLRAARSVQELAASEAALAEAQRIARMGSFVLDVERGVLSASAELARMLGRPDAPAELAWSAVLERVHPDDREAVAAAHGPSRPPRHEGELDLHFRLGSQAAPPTWVHELAVVADDAAGPLVRGTLQDVTTQRHREERAEYLATHDLATGLLNRSGILRHVEWRLAGGRPAGGRAAIVSVALQRFDELTGRLGAERADMLLREVAQRLRRSCVCEGINGGPSAAARTGPATFSLLFERLAGEEDAIACARALVGLFAPPLEFGEHAVHVDARAGVAVHPDDGASASALLRAADAALHHPGAEGSPVRRYEPGLGVEAEQRLRLERDLRAAIDRREIAVHFQPQVGPDGTVIAVEALARWEHPTQGAIPPADFIPVAEDSGLIHALGRQVLETALGHLAAWRRDGAAVRLAVNLSASQLAESDLVGLVARALDRHGLDGSALEIEVTEHVLLDEGWQVQRNLDGLAALGTSLALDDFGTGYSSLSYLARLPLDALKVDRTFVARLDQPATRSVVRSIIALAEGLGLRTIAEGVETPEQAEILREEGCDALQGYLIGRPGPADRLPPVLREALRPR